MKGDMEKIWSRFLSETTFAKTFAEQWLPSVEISESKGRFYIKTDLPGFEPRHVNVNLSFIVKKDKIEVAFKKGVLELKVPKTR